MDRVTAILAEIGLWLCAFRLWLAEAGEAVGLGMGELRRRLRTELREAAREAEIALLLLAMPRLIATAPLAMGPDCRWRSGPSPGFRRVRCSTAPRRAYRRALASRSARGSLHGRLARIEDLLRRRAWWIARLVRRIEKGPHGALVAAVRPPACACVDACAPRAAEPADTS
jgi:hypothetical protein